MTTIPVELRELLESADEAYRKADEALANLKKIRDLLAEQPQDGAGQAAPVVPGTNCDQLGSRLAQLASWASNTVEFLRNADVSSGVCCCGDNMKGHADPMVSGHNPVDMWDNAVVELARELDSMLSAPAQPAAPSEQMPCPACDGKGELYHPHAGDEYRCEYCDGSGEVEKAAARHDQGDEVLLLEEKKSSERIARLKSVRIMALETECARLREQHHNEVRRLRKALEKVGNRLEAFLDDEMDMPHDSMEVCKAIIDAALTQSPKGEEE